MRTSTKTTILHNNKDEDNNKDDFNLFKNLGNSILLIIYFKSYIL